MTQEPDYEFKFSSGQMVMIICGLLGVMLLCFMGGLVLGKKESAVPALASKPPVEQAKPASTKAPKPATASQRKPTVKRVSSKAPAPKPAAPKPATATPKAAAQAKDVQAENRSGQNREAGYRCQTRTETHRRQTACAETCANG